MNLFLRNVGYWSLEVGQCRTETFSPVDEIGDDVKCDDILGSSLWLTRVEFLSGCYFGVKLAEPKSVVFTIWS